jgi:hypothetical protein
MPTNRTVEFSLTWNQVAAFRLARHHLLERAPEKGLAATDITASVAARPTFDIVGSVAGDIVGVQAQLLSAAHIGLWSRVRDLHLADIDKALHERILVKTACMRQTQFLVPSEQLAIFVRGSARRAAKDIRWTRGKGVPDRTIDAAIDAALISLDQPRTRPEIAERVCQLLGVQVQAVEGGAGWGSRKKVAAVPVGEIKFPVVYLLRLVAARGVVCSGPNRGNEPTFVRADAWIPRWQDISTEQAETLLLRKYLRAFEPATTADFALWSGMTLREARTIWAREQSDFIQVDVEGWIAEVLREDLDVLARSRLEKPVETKFTSLRLLPYFDTFLLGHKKRDHLVAREYQPSIYRPQGWIAPVILTDGRAVAAWDYTREGETLYVKVTPLHPLSPGIITGIQEEVRNLGQFLGVPFVDIQMN